MDPDAFSRRVWTAHADAWQQQGVIRGTSLGGWTELPGVRLMASGLPYPQWNNADVMDSSLVDIGAIRRWYGDRGVPWGARVPTGMRWPHGHLVLSQHLMGQTREQFKPAAAVAGVTVGAATPGDLERVLMVDAESFGSDVETTRPWMTPLLHDSRVTVVIASDVRGPIGTGYAVRSDGHAGHAVYIGGVGVLEHARRCGVGSTISSWLLQRSYAQGAEMASLQPDTDEAALVYARLGFIGAVDYHVYVDVSPERDDGTSFREPHEP